MPEKAPSVIGTASRTALESIPATVKLHAGCLPNQERENQEQCADPNHQVGPLFETPDQLENSYDQR